MYDLGRYIGHREGVWLILEDPRLHVCVRVEVKCAFDSTDEIRYGAGQRQGDDGTARQLARAAAALYQIQLELGRVHVDCLSVVVGDDQPLNRLCVVFGAVPKAPVSSSAIAPRQPMFTKQPIQSMPSLAQQRRPRPALNLPQACRF